MANNEIEDDAPVISYEADPESFKTIVLKVHKKLANKNDPYVSQLPQSDGEKDAMLMSIDCPNEPFLTVYQNGIPLTLSVNELIKDVMISIMMKED